MTQVPGRFLPLPWELVVPRASTPDSPAQEQSATQELATRLARTIDPDVWAAREEDQRTLGSKWDFKIRRMDSMNAAAKVLADTELLDALVAYRLCGALRYFVSNVACLHCSFDDIEAMCARIAELEACVAGIARYGLHADLNPTMKFGCDAGQMYVQLTTYLRSLNAELRESARRLVPDEVKEEQ